MARKRSTFGQADVVKLGNEDDVVPVLETAIAGLWDVVSDLTRIRRTTRNNYRVTIFGSARLKPGSEAYLAVKKLAASLTSMGCDILTGGGPGLMQAANEGAHFAASGVKRRSIGINIELPTEQQVNPYVGKAYAHRTFFSRLHHFMIASDAIIVTPGGIGTLLELSLAWQLLQVRHLHNVPLVLVGDMWSGLVDWATNSMTERGSLLANQADMAIPTCVKTLDEAVAIIRKNRREWLAAQRAA